MTNIQNDQTERSKPMSDETIEDRVALLEKSERKYREFKEGITIPNLSTFYKENQHEKLFSRKSEKARRGC